MGKANILRFECLLLLGIGCYSNPVFSQTTFEEYKKQAHESFQKFKEQKYSEFEAYRDRVNAEFAGFMSKAWPEFKSEPAIPIPPSVEPPEPVVVQPDEKPTNVPLPFSKVKPLPLVSPPPIPLIPTSTPKKPSTPIISTPPIPSTPPPPTEPQKPSVPAPPDEPKKPEFPKTPTKPSGKPINPDTPSRPSESILTFEYYGSKCAVPFEKSLKISLRSIDENSVSKAWRHLASKESVGLIERCVSLRQSLKLSDWGYFRLVEELAEAAYPGRVNEAALLKMFVLTQSGYKVRIGRNGNHLVVLIPFRETVYEYKYIPIGGVKYYIVDRNVSSQSTCVYNQEFPKEQMFSLAVGTQPVLSMDAAPTRTYQSDYGSGISTRISVNRNLIAFYDDYPLSNNWMVNANASLSNEVKAQLYPSLRKAIVGKSQREAANVLLRFVQTAFDYMTDDKQFGEERSLFPDESFYYPYSDCEDRAILYTVLVRELLNLEAVLVYYPGHLATAVKFDEEVKGDYFNIDGAKYIVCDPTYINADVGMSMPTYKGASAEIVRL